MAGDELSFGRHSDGHSILEASAEWYSIMRADQVSDEDLRQWNAWLLAAPEHRSAWERVMSISNKFETMPTVLNARAASQALAALPAKRRQAVKLLALLCTVGLGGVLASRTRYASSLFAQYRTGVGEQRQLTLADGTALWLNTETSVDIDYGSAARHVTLISGEIQIKTAPDNQWPPRPFSVGTEQGSLRPLGTQFTVRSEGPSTNVAVFEGAVEITPRHASQASQARPVVQAGMQMAFTSTGTGEIGAAETLRRDWIHGALTADDMRLADFLTELGRYHTGILSCSPEVANLRIVGSYPVRDMPAILAALASSLPISVKQYTKWWVSINKKSI